MPFNTRTYLQHFRCAPTQPELLCLLKWVLRDFLQQGINAGNGLSRQKWGFLRLIPDRPSADCDHLAPKKTNLKWQGQNKSELAGQKWHLFDRPLANLRWPKASRRNPRKTRFRQKVPSQTARLGGPRTWWVQGLQEETWMVRFSTYTPYGRIYKLAAMLVIVGGRWNVDRTGSFHIGCSGSRFGSSQTPKEGN